MLRNEVDPSIGKLRGGVTVFSPVGFALAILPGNNRGEIFAAGIGGPRKSEQADPADLRSALSVPATPPSVSFGDTVAVAVGPQTRAAKVVAGNVAGQGGHSSRRFLWLDKYLDRPTDDTTVLVFNTSAAAPDQVTITAVVAPYKLKFVGVASLPDWVLVDDGSGGAVWTLVNVIDFNPATGIATVNRQTAPLNAVVDYWLPTEIQGRVYPVSSSPPPTAAAGLSARSSRDRCTSQILHRVGKR